MPRICVHILRYVDEYSVDITASAIVCVCVRDRARMRVSQITDFGIIL